jgi:hypothetical protein
LRRKIAAISLAAGIVPVCLLPAPAHADGRLLLGGAEIRREGAYYAYFGALLPFPGNNHLGNGWVQRYWLDSFSYNYDTTERITATAYGAEAALGYQRSDDQGRSWGAYGGFRYQNTILKPFDPGSEVQGVQFWPRAQLEGDAPLSGRWRANGIASVTLGIQGYYLRGRLLRGLRDGPQIGPELILQGDPNYSAQRLGAVLGGLRLTNRLFMNLHAGYHFQTGQDSPYVGVEGTWLF